MADQAPKTTSLTPEEWKQLVLLNAAQLSNYLQSIPGNVEGGAAGITDVHLAEIEKHMARGRNFMRAWRVSKLPMAPLPPQNDARTDDAAKGNGAVEPPKRKGGWPAGKPRTRQAKAPAVTQ